MTAVSFHCVLYLLTLLVTLLCGAVSNKEVRIVSLEEYPAYEAYNQGVAFARKNDYQQAMQAYHRALKFKPDLCEAHQNMAALYGRRNLKDHHSLCLYIQPPTFSTVLPFHQLGMILLVLSLVLFPLVPMQTKTEI